MKNKKSRKREEREREEIDVKREKEEVAKSEENLLHVFVVRFSANTEERSNKGKKKKKKNRDLAKRISANRARRKRVIGRIACDSNIVACFVRFRSRGNRCPLPSRSGFLRQAVGMSTMIGRDAKEEEVVNDSPRR